MGAWLAERSKAILALLGASASLGLSELNTWVPVVTAILTVVAVYAVPNKSQETVKTPTRMP